MHIVNQLELKHPFYRAWTNGTLPVDALRVYAQDYGQFIAALPRGWAAIGDKDYTAEEESHIPLWEEFAQSLGTSIGCSGIPQIQQLMATCDRTYFEVHRHMQCEAEELARLLDGLDAAEQQRAADACSEMAEALWNSLTGILEAAGLPADCATA
jgi:pyrroloquinoline-quinone synthase